MGFWPGLGPRQAIELPTWIWRTSVNGFFGTDFTDDAVSDLGAVAVRIWAPKFLLHTILRRGVDFALYFDALAEIY